MPEIPAEAVQAAAEALRSHNHGFTFGCEICRAGTEGRARLALEAAAPFLAEHVAQRILARRCPERSVCGSCSCRPEDARVAREAFLAGAGSPTACPSVASESTESAQTPSAAPVYRPEVEKPTESLTAPHGEDAHPLASSHASEHAELRQRCADRLLAKDAESWGYGTFEGDREAALAVADEVLAVRDDELAAAVQRADQAEATLLELAPLRDRTDAEDRLRRERNEWREQCEQVEAAIARVKGLHSEIPYKPGFCYCANPYPCLTIRALDGAGAVPGEHTGSGNG